MDELAEAAADLVDLSDLAGAAALLRKQSVELWTLADMFDAAAKKRLDQRPAVG